MSNEAVTNDSSGADSQKQQQSIFKTLKMNSKILGLVGSFDKMKASILNLGKSSKNQNGQKGDPFCRSSLSILSFGSWMKPKQAEPSPAETSNIEAQENGSVTESCRCSINCQFDSKDMVDELERRIRRLMIEGRRSNGSDLCPNCDLKITGLEDHLLELCSLLKDKLVKHSNAVEDYKEEIKTYKSVVDSRPAIAESLNCQACEEMKNDMRSLKECNKKYQAEIASLKEELQEHSDSNFN